MMNRFLSIQDVDDVNLLIDEGLILKRNPLAWNDLGRNRTLGLIFMNPSLRTRLSTQKAGMNLGMNVMVMNMSQDGWQLEMDDGTVMDGSTQEHIRDAARVVSQYCDVIGLRTFAGLKDREEDRTDPVLHRFDAEAYVPLVNMESATGHPLQSLADMMTIRETMEMAGRTEPPRVVLTWAPHPKALPQAVPNSFAEWSIASGMDLVITHPEGYELEERFTKGATFEPDQEKAIEGADFVYAKNWSATEPYGEVLNRDENWMITMEKMRRTNEGMFMHCLPVRRNVIVSDEVLDSDRSIVIREACNRTYAAQIVLKELLEAMIREPGCA